MTICKQTLEYLTVSVNNGTFLKRKIYLVEMSARQSPAPSPAQRNVPASPSSPAKQENHRNITINVDNLINFLRHFESEEQAFPAMARLTVSNTTDNAEDDVGEWNAGSGIIEIPSMKITAILNNIEGCKYNQVTLHTINDYANTEKYKNADFFRNQVVYAFYKMVQLQARFNPRTLNFEEVMKYLKMLLVKCDQSERADIFADCKLNARLN